MSHDSDISPLTRLIARMDRASDSLSDTNTPGEPLSQNTSLILPTGFPSIDRALGGGFRKGDLVVVGGDISSGCSALLLGLALRATLTPTPRALLLTSETLPERVYERALSMSARVALEAIQMHTVSTDERTRLATAALTLRDRVPVVETISSAGIDDAAEAIAAIAANAANEASQHAQLVIIDSLDGLLRSEHSHKESLAYAVLALKRLALKHNIVVLLATHLPDLNPQRPDKRPTLSDFGFSGAAGVHADLVLGLYREELYDGDLGVSGAAELLILKHRHGPRGYVDLYFDTRYGRFEDVLEE